MSTPEKILGQKFGKLTPYKPADGPTTDKGRQTFWVCRCSCGGVAKVRQDRLLSGKTKSCGCLATAHRDHLAEMAFARQLARAVAGETVKRNTPPKPPRAPITQAQIASYKKVYGLTPEAWAGMLAGQDGKCAICSAHIEDTALVVDHDHATGAVRGLLCRQCNSGLGYFKDSIPTLGAAIGYLAK